MWFVKWFPSVGFSDMFEKNSFYQIPTGAFFRIFLSRAFSSRRTGTLVLGKKKTLLLGKKMLWQSRIDSRSLG